MEETMNGLALLLLRQAGVQKSLLALEERKTRVLLKGTTEELNEVLNAQQPFLMQSSNLERQRANLQERLGLKKPEMRRILALPETDGEKRLNGAFALLKEAVSRLKKAVDLNGRILEARVDTRNNLARIFGIGNDVLTYSK